MVLFHPVLRSKTQTSSDYFFWVIIILEFCFSFSINNQVNCVSSHTCLLSVHVAIITDCSDNRNLFSWLNISTRHSAQTGYAENRLLFHCAHLYSHWAAGGREILTKRSVSEWGNEKSKPENYVPNENHRALLCYYAVRGESSLHQFFFRLFFAKSHLLGFCG